MTGDRFVRLFQKKPHLKENLDEQASRTSSPCKSFVGLGEVSDRARGWGVAWERGDGAGSLVVSPFLRQGAGDGGPGSGGTPHSQPPTVELETPGEGDSAPLWHFQIKNYG